MTNSGGEQVGRQVLVTLTHGYVQKLADELGVDLLHLKGRAVDERLARRSASGESVGRFSLDVDVLVRPEHVDRLVEALLARGWAKITGFVQGSAFAHAMNLRHDFLGNIDLHRWWPGFGIEPAQAFDLLWGGHRTSMQIANVECDVPDLAAQRLLLLLHAGRTGGVHHPDYEACWPTATPQEQHQIRELADCFDAALPLAAALGELENHRGAPGYLLWRHFSEGSQNRWDEWAGRWQAAEGVRAKADVVRGFVSINPDLLRQRVGANPGARDYVDEYLLRVQAAAAELRHGLRSRRGRRVPR
ncbi:nucleotidyltransferase family protein [Yimella sp. cx-573]|nr:nucleotidyltransferase family protein [Yimella sp. cx-573]